MHSSHKNGRTSSKNLTKRSAAQKNHGRLARIRSETASRLQNHIRIAAMRHLSTRAQGYGGLEPDDIKFAHNSKSRSNRGHKKHLTEPQPAALTNFGAILDDWDKKTVSFTNRKIQQANDFATQKIAQKQRNTAKANELFTSHGLRAQPRDQNKEFQQQSKNKRQSVPVNPYASSFIGDDSGDDDIYFDSTKQKHAVHSTKNNLQHDHDNFDATDADDDDANDDIEQTNEMYSPSDLSKQLNALNVSKRGQKDTFSLLRTRLKAAKSAVKQLQSGKTRTTEHNKDLTSFQTPDLDTTTAASDDLSNTPLESPPQHRSTSSQTDSITSSQTRRTKNTAFTQQSIQTTRVFRDLAKKREIVHSLGLFLGSFDILPSLSQEIQQSSKQIVQYRHKYKHSFELILRSLVIDHVTHDARITARMANVTKGKSLFAYLQRHANELVHSKTGKPLRKTIGSYGTDYDETDITLGMHRTMVLLKHRINKIRQQQGLPPFQDHVDNIEEYMTNEDLSTVDHVALPDGIIMNIMLNSCAKEIASGWDKSSAQPSQPVTTASIFRPDAVLTKDIPEAQTYLSDDALMQQGVQSRYNSVDFPEVTTASATRDVASLFGDIPHLTEHNTNGTAANPDGSNSRHLKSSINNALYAKGMTQYRQNISRYSPQAAKQLPHQHPATLLALQMLDYMAFTSQHPQEVRNFLIHRQERVIQEHLIVQQEDDALLQQYVAAYTDATNSSGYHPGKRSATLYRELEQLEVLYSALDRELSQKRKSKTNNSSFKPRDEQEHTDLSEDDTESEDITPSSSSQSTRLSDGNAKKLLSLTGKKLGSRFMNVANSVMHKRFPAHMVLQKMNSRYANATQDEIGDKITLLKTKLLARAKAKLDLKRRFIGVFADVDDLRRERPDYKIWAKNNMLDKFTSPMEQNQPIQEEEKEQDDTTARESSQQQNSQQLDFTPLTPRDGYNTYDVIDQETGKLKLHQSLQDSVQQEAQTALDNVHITLSPDVEEEIIQSTSSCVPTVSSFLPLLRVAGDTNDIVLTQALLLRLIQWDTLFTANNTLESDEMALLQIRGKVSQLETLLMDMEAEGVSSDHPNVLKTFNDLHETKRQETNLDSRVAKQRKDLHDTKCSILSGLSIGKPLSMLQISQFIAFWNRLLTISSADYVAMSTAVVPPTHPDAASAGAAPIADEINQLQQPDASAQAAASTVSWPTWIFPAPQQLDAFKDMLIFEGVNLSSLHCPPPPIARPGRPVWPLLSPLNIDVELTDICLKSAQHTEFWSKAFNTDYVQELASHYARVSLQPRWIQDQIQSAERARLFPLDHLAQSIPAAVDGEDDHIGTLPQANSSALQKIVDNNIITNKERIDAFQQQMDEWNIAQTEITLRRQNKKNTSRSARKQEKSAQSSSGLDPERPYQYEPMDKLIAMKKPTKPQLLPTSVEQIRKKYQLRVEHDSREMVVSQERAQRIASCINGWVNNIDIKQFQQRLAYRSHFSFGFLHVLSTFLHIPLTKDGFTVSPSQIIQQYTRSALIQPSVTSAENEPARLRAIAAQTPSSGTTSNTTLITHEDLNRQLVYPAPSMFSNLFNIAKQLTTHSFAAAYAKSLLPVFSQQQKLGQSVQLVDVVDFEKNITSVGHSLFQHGVLPLLAVAAPHNTTTASWPPQTPLLSGTTGGQSSSIQQLSQNPRLQAYLSAVPRCELHSDHLTYVRDQFSKLFVDLGSGDGEHALSHARSSLQRATGGGVLSQPKHKPDAVIACDILTHRMENLAWKANYGEDNNAVQSWFGADNHTVFDLLVKDLIPVARDREDVPEMTSRPASSSSNKTFQSFGSAEIARYMMQSYDQEKTRLVMDIAPEPVKIVHVQAAKMAKHAIQRAGSTVAHDSPQFESTVHSALQHIIQLLTVHCQAGKRFEHFLQFMPVNDITVEMCYSPESRSTLDELEALYGQQLIGDCTPRRLFGRLVLDNTFLLATPFDAKPNSATQPATISEPIRPFIPSNSQSTTVESTSSSQSDSKLTQQYLAPRRQLPNLFVHCGSAISLLAALPAQSVDTINFTHPPPPTHESFLPNNIDISQPHTFQTLQDAGQQGLLNELVLLLAARSIQPKTGSVFILSDDDRVSKFLHRLFHNSVFRPDTDSFATPKKQPVDAVTKALSNTDSHQQSFFSAPAVSKWFTLEELNLSSGDRRQGNDGEQRDDGDEPVDAQSRYMSLAKNNQISSARPYQDGQSRAWRLVRNDIPWE